MIDLVIIEYGYRKEDKRKRNYRAKEAFTRLELQIIVTMSFRKDL